MILSFKLTTTGLEIGKPYTTLAKEANSVTVVDRGFDFYVKTDQILNAGPLTFNGAGGANLCKIRLGLNIPFMTVYKGDGTTITPGTGTGNSTNTNLFNCGTNNKIQEAMDTLGNYGTEYFYLGKLPDQDTVCLYKTTTDPHGVPDAVKESGKRTETLVRLTIAGPFSSGSSKFVPGIVGYRYALANGLGTKYVMSSNSTPGFGAGPIKTLVKINEDTANGTPYDSTIIFGPTLRNPRGNSAENNSQCYFDSFYSFLSQQFEVGYKEGSNHYYDQYCLQTSEPESIGYFESKGRDFSISPVLRLENGDLDFNAIRDTFNSSKMSATRLITTVMTSDSGNSDTNPSIPSSPDDRFNSAFVKI